MTQPTPTPLPPLSPAERADLDALLSQGWRYDGWTSADDRLSKLEGYTERLVAQLAAAEAERDRARATRQTLIANGAYLIELLIEANRLFSRVDDITSRADEAIEKLTADRDALRARAERAEALVERYAYDCDACGGMGTAAGRMAQGSPPCKVCQPARAYFQEPPARAGEVTG